MIDGNAPTNKIKKVKKKNYKNYKNYNHVYPYTGLHDTLKMRNHVC